MPNRHEPKRFTQQIVFPPLAGCLVAGALLAMLVGCPPENFPNTISGNQDDVNAIVNDTDLSAQQQRDALLALGLTPSTINGLLSSERTGNQFGGTLSTAFDKVANDRFTSLTPDEVQLYSDAAEEANTALSFTLTDLEALAVTDLFAAESLNSSEEVLAFVNDANNEIPTNIPDDFLTDVFVDLDPNAIVDQLP